MQRQRQETSRQVMGKETQRVYERGIKQKSMICMASIAGKQANEQKGKQARKQTKGDVHKGHMLV